MRTPFIKGCATDSTKDHANVAIFTTWSSQCHPLLISKGWFLSNAIWGQHLTWNSLNSPNNRKMVNQTDTSLPPPMATDDSGSDSLEIIWAQLQATTGHTCSKTHMNEHISLISSCLELWWQLIIKDSNTSTLGQRQWPAEGWNWWITISLLSTMIANAIDTASNVRELGGDVLCHAQAKLL